eukprot:gnl/MRDRNA2_/MRDRNA2_96534_c0_seq1.p1 gnl/MRDRNA2_/MRDRNA2_96534_c0~~gnl/MRDRNA2_/MRDRNA2_96534_c0_seq1.p1  ORF type:complete len:395 (-),score=70.06 gnl/MRDRNA2_/MRDRNA2_96534_c0_seq1:61-1245(-)
MEFLQQDVDRLFSYSTKQQVLVKDRLLGIVSYAIMLGILAYVIGFVFISERQYLETEPAKGAALVYFSGEDLAESAVGSHSRFFSAEEIAHLGLENGNLFVTTKVNIQHEERGVCEDTNKPCRKAEDCSPGVGATCSPNKYCMEPSWCPVGSPEDFKLASDQSHIWVKSAITFNGLAKEKMFSTDMSKVILFPEPHHNAYKVRDLLQQCDPPVRFEEVGELGAAVQVEFIWNCQVDSILPCEKQIHARRIDSLLDQNHIGYNFKHVEYDVENPDKRTRYKSYGIRFYFSTVGVGSKVSMAMIIFQLSTGMALVGFAPIFADIIMMQCLRMSKKYHARKYDYTQDFSDYFQEISGADMAEGLKDEFLGATEEDDDDEADEQDREWRYRLEEMDED